MVRGVALRPAHPVLLAVVAATPVIGVPGYPVSAALACERFALPVLDRLLDARPRERSSEPAVLGAPVMSRRDAEVVVPVMIERRPGRLPVAWPQSRRGAALSGYARADATLTLPAGAPALAEGDEVSLHVR